MGLTSGGRVTNGSATSTSALISGAHGVYIAGAAGTVTNFGTIERRVRTAAGSPTAPLDQR